MRNPVCLSSGVIVDKRSYLDANGNRRFTSCPITREPIKAEAYPVNSMRRQVVEWRVAMFDKAVELATKLEAGIDEYSRICDLAESILEDIGEDTYIHRARRLAQLHLQAIAKVQDPLKIAKIYERIMRTTGNVEERDQFIADEASKLFTGAWKALQTNELEKCECFIKAVEYCKAKKFRIASELQMARLNLTLAKK